MSKPQKLDKENTIRLIVAIAFFIVTAAVTVLVIPYIELFSTDEGLEGVKEQVQQKGIVGVLFFIFLTVIQVIIAFIPGGPVEILAGMLFDSVTGTLLCVIGFLIGTTVVYFMVKKIGKPLANAFVSEEQFKKFKFLQNEQKLEMIIFILFLIPGIPKDALTYLIPLTKINGMRFILLATLARVPATVSSVMIGSSIGNENIATGAAAFVITAALGIAGIIFGGKRDRENVK